MTVYGSVVGRERNHKIRTLTACQQLEARYQVVHRENERNRKKGKQRSEENWIPFVVRSLSFNKKKRYTHIQPVHRSSYPFICVDRLSAVGVCVRNRSGQSSGVLPGQDKLQERDSSLNNIRSRLPPWQPGLLETNEQGVYISACAYVWLCRCVCARAL